VKVRHVEGVVTRNGPEPCAGIREGAGEASAGVHRPAMFSPRKPKTVLFVSGDDRDAKALMVELINSTGFVALDLGSLADGGAMQQLGGPLSAVELHFVRRIVR